MVCSGDERHVHDFGYRGSDRGNLFSGNIEEAGLRIQVQRVLCVGLLKRDAAAPGNRGGRIDYTTNTSLLIEVSSILVTGFKHIPVLVISIK